MKKQLILIALLMVALVGCNRTKSSDNAFEVETYSLTDSVFIENDYDKNYSRYAVSVDIPVTKNDSLRENIIQWIFGGDVEDYVTYFEDERDYFFSEEGDEPGSSLASNYTLSEQTDLYVTYISEGYVFTGGAHPMPWYYGTSFSKLDGSVIDYDIFNEPQQIVGLLSESIVNQYFNVYNTEEEEYIFEPNESFQLPTNHPWIETDSLVFCYQPYEIAPYSAGMPLCKIAIVDLKPYLSDRGKELLNVK